MSHRPFPFTIPSFYFPTRFKCQHTPFLFKNQFEIQKHCLELYFKISVVCSTFSDSFCTATACRRLSKESQSIPLSALLSFYSSEWLIIIERFCELPIVLKLKRLWLSSKPPGDGLKVKIFARVLFLEDTQHLMIASVPQSWLWCLLACQLHAKIFLNWVFEFVVSSHLRGDQLFWIFPGSPGMVQIQELWKLAQVCNLPSISPLKVLAAALTAAVYVRIPLSGTPSMLWRSTKAL